MSLSTFDISSRETLDIFKIMAYIAELNEWDNRPHLERIWQYCQVIATGLMLPQQEIEILIHASLLHDIGKIRLPEYLLKKTGYFDKLEWEIVEAHTIYGSEILSGSSSPILQEAEIIAGTHHERWDGSGYPRGLKRDEIPLSGRITALADVFDALTTQRPYKDPVDYRKGLEIIQEASGSLFDPTLVRIFTQKYDEIIRIVSC